MKWTSICGVILVVLLSTTAQAQTPPPQTNDRSVVINGAPKMSVATFQQVLQDAKSPAAPDAEAIYNLSTTYDIEPSFLLAIFKHESSFGTDPNWAGWKDAARLSSTNNVGNIRCTAGYQCYDGWRDYPTWVEGARDLYGLLSYYYVERNGLDTVRKILTRYAPSSENDTEGYIRSVLADMQRWEGGDSSASSGDRLEGPGRQTPEYWVWGPGLGLVYEVMRFGAMFLWQLNKAIFIGDESLRSVDQALTGGFEQILMVVGQSMGASSGPIALLGLMIAALLLVCVPFFEQRVVTVHRALLAPIAVVLLLPAAGITYRYAIDILNATGTTVSTNVGGTAARLFSFDYPAIPGTASISKLDRYYGQAEVEPVDVAAAYMWATRTDVVNDIALPTQFDRTYFQAADFFTQHQNDSPPVANWSQMPNDQRLKFLYFALLGLVRATTGIVITTGALLNRVLLLLFKLGLGLSVMGLILVLPFIALDVFAASAIELLRQLPRLIVSSIGLTALQSIVLALLFVLARAGSPWGVFITSVLSGILTLGLVWIVGSMIVRNGLMVLSAGATGGFEAAQDAGRFAWAGVAGLVGGVVASRRAIQQRAAGPSLLQDSAEKFRDAAMSYTAATEAGHSPAFARGYALSGSRRGRALARVSMAAGLFGGEQAEETERGLRSGVIAGKEDPSSLRSILLMRQAPKQPRLSPGQAVGARYVKDVTPLAAPPSNGPELPPPPASGPILPPSPAPPALPSPASQPPATGLARVYPLPPRLPGPILMPAPMETPPIIVVQDGAAATPTQPTIVRVQRTPARNDAQRQRLAHAAQLVRQHQEQKDNA